MFAYSSIEHMGLTTFAFGESRCEDHTLSAPDGSRFVTVT